MNTCRSGLLFYPLLRYEVDSSCRSFCRSVWRAWLSRVQGAQRQAASLSPYLPLRPLRTEKELQTDVAPRPAADTGAGTWPLCGLQSVSRKKWITFKKLKLLLRTVNLLMKWKWLIVSIFFLRWWIWSVPLSVHCMGFPLIRRDTYSEDNPSPHEVLHFSNSAMGEILVHRGKCIGKLSQCLVDSFCTGSQLDPVLRVQNSYAQALTYVLACQLCTQSQLYPESTVALTVMAWNVHFSAFLFLFNKSNRYGQIGVNIITIWLYMIYTHWQY